MKRRNRIFRHLPNPRETRYTRAMNALGDLLLAQGWELKGGGFRNRWIFYTLGTYEGEDEPKDALKRILRDWISEILPEVPNGILPGIPNGIPNGIPTESTNGIVRISRVFEGFRVTVNLRALIEQGRGYATLALARKVAQSAGARGLPFLSIQSIRLLLQVDDNLKISTRQAIKIMSLLETAGVAVRNGYLSTLGRELDPKRLRAWLTRGG